MDLAHEKARVTFCASRAGYGVGVMGVATTYCGKIFQKFMKMGGVLELGPAEGIMTDFLFPRFSEDYTIVDGAADFAKALQERYPGMECHACLFEEFHPERCYENIILGHVLEHVTDPVDILKKCRQWLSPQGRIIAAVPNSESIHRQAAVKMGLLSSTKQLNETDMKNGHRRIYDMRMLEKDFLDADFSIIESGGYWMKPLSNAQIEQDWTPEMIEAFMSLGEDFPEIAAEIYIAAEKREASCTG